MPAGPMMTATKLPEIVGVTQLLAESELALTLCGSNAGGFEDALGLAEVALAKRQVPSPDRESVLRTARNALRKIEPELHRQKGFAVFAKMSSAGGVVLPRSVPNLAVVGTRFYIKPILGLLDRDPAFFVLVSSLGATRLLSCDRYSWTEVPLTLAGGGTVADAAEASERSLEDHVRRVSAALKPHLPSENLPLVLAAEPGLLERLHALGDLARVIGPGLALDPEAHADADLHDRALAEVLAETGSPVDPVIEEILARLSAGDITVAVEPDQIVSAALHGRVDAAVVAIDETLWGKVQPPGGRVSAPARPSRHDEELLNLIVVETIKRGGRAFAVPHAAMPQYALAAALLRY